MAKRRLFSIFSILLIVALLSSIFPVSVLAQERIGKVTGSNVNVRQGPGTQYARITNLSAGQFVTILEERITGSRPNWLTAPKADRRLVN